MSCTGPAGKVLTMKNVVGLLVWSSCLWHPDVSGEYMLLLAGGAGRGGEEEVGDGRTGRKMREEDGEIVGG
jgi:hypothetical protein